jgi:hypothetical protein
LAGYVKFLIDYRNLAIPAMQAILPSAAFSVVAVSALLAWLHVS